MGVLRWYDAASAKSTGLRVHRSDQSLVLYGLSVRARRRRQHATAPYESLSSTGRVIAAWSRTSGTQGWIMTRDVSIADENTEMGDAVGETLRGGAGNRYKGKKPV